MWFRRAHLASFSGFAFSTLIGGVASVATIPALVSLFGSLSWATLAVAQSAGMLLAVFVGFGWGVVGPATTAALQFEERREYFANSFAARLTLWILAVPLAGLLCLILLQGQEAGLAGFFVCLATATYSLGAGWYFVGSGDSKAFLLVDTVPRVMAMLIGVLFASLTANVLTYGVVYFLGQLCAVFAAAYWVGGSGILRGADFSARRLLRSLRGNSSAVLMAFTSSLYFNLPLLIVSIFGVPAQVASFALADRLRSFAIQALSPLAKVAQGYVPAVRDFSTRMVRSKRAILVSALLASSTSVAYFVILLAFAPRLSGQNLEVEWDVALPMAVAIFGSALSGVVGLACLVAFGEARWMAFATILGALIGTPLALGLWFIAGSAGVASALAASELLVLSAQLARLVKIRRDGRSV